MQFGVGPLGSAQLPARGDPLARQGGFPAQPRGQRRYTRLMLAPAGQSGVDQCHCHITAKFADHPPL